MPSMDIKEKFSQDEKKVGENIVIPGLTDRTNQPMKKPVVIMSDKYQPNFTCKHIEDNAVQFIFQVDEETSAKAIQLDISANELKLDSPNYELHEKFNDFSIDESTVKAKFSKKAGTLTLTIQKN